jgi:hypothetical protein
VSDDDIGKRGQHLGDKWHGGRQGAGGTHRWRCTADLRSRGPKPQPLLAISAGTHTLPGDKRTFPVCRGGIEPTGEQSEDSGEITIIEASYQVVTDQRTKYAARATPPWSPHQLR